MAETSALDLDAELRKWSRSLPKWQQYALMLLDQGGKLTSEQEERVFMAVLAENGLGEWPEPFEAYEVTSAGAPRPDGAPRWRLRSLRDLRGINALCEGQELGFGDGLTVVFGLNGSGKSGYARVLAQACGEGRAKAGILPNVFEPGATRPQGAVFSVATVDEGRQSDVPWHPGAPVAQLAGVRYLDSQVVAHRVGSPSESEVGPIELRVFGRLVRLMKNTLEPKRRAMCEDLRRRAAQLRVPLEACQRAVGPATQQFLAGLSAATKQSDIDHVARPLTEPERADADRWARRTTEIRGELAALEQTRRGALADEQALRTLRSALADACDRLGNACELRVRSAMTEFVARQEAAQARAAQGFGADGNADTSSPSWRHFIEAARAYAQHSRSDPHCEYPQAGDMCLFCGQTLSPPAVDLIRRYWGFITDDSVERLRAARDEVEQCRRELNAIDLGAIDSDRAAFVALGRRAEPLRDALSRAFELLRQRRDALVGVLGGTAETVVPPPPASPEAELDVLLDALRAQAAASAESLSEELQNVTDQLTALADRESFAAVATDAAAHVDALRDLERADGITIDGRAITKRHGEIHREVVTPAYLADFRSTCAALGLSVNVVPTFPGKDGERMCRLALAVSTEDGSKTLPDTPVGAVLSEGEQRLAAVADFLTEASALPGTETIVLDDPVNSLDHRWSASLARVLVELAAERQVVVFTHDLGFVHQLEVCSGHASQVAVLSASARSAGWVSGKDTLELSSQMGGHESIAQDRKRLVARSYRGESEVELGDELRALVSRVRLFCEAFVCNRLLRRLVLPCDAAVRMGKLAEVRWDCSTAQRLVALHRRASDLLPGHYHAPTQNCPLTVDAVSSLVDEAVAISLAYAEAGRRPSTPSPSAP